MRGVTRARVRTTTGGWTARTEASAARIRRKTTKKVLRRSLSFP
jgi:hypothetical protein